MIACILLLFFTLAVSPTNDKDTGSNNNQNYRNSSASPFDYDDDGDSDEAWDMDLGLPQDPYRPPIDRFTYQRRARPPSATQLAQNWGEWTFVDPKRLPSQRPQQDYYQAYPHRDIPRTEFPFNAWQTDSEYLAAFLPQALALVHRAQTAILAEYGHYNVTSPISNWQEQSHMFQLHKYPNASEFTTAATKTLQGLTQGGATTVASWEGLKRRVLHAIMTEDKFVFAMGGHSAAAGHGNHFQQSYTLQVQWILEPVFARLGVKHEARNFGNGGLGTAHNGFGAGSIYGSDVDMLMWDSSMTEKEGKAQDAFHRQGLLGSGEDGKVPALWTLANSVAIDLHRAVGADVGIVGNGNDGIPKASSLEEIQQMPWAVRYMKCSNEMKQICKQHEYDGTCWIDRPDVIPPKTQRKEPGGRAGWHPGNRKHQITGRVLAFTILEALRESLQVWNDAPGYILEDSTWHVMEHYENVRERLTKLDPGFGKCSGYVDDGLGFVCTLPMKARTEFTPRAYPFHSSLRSLMHPDMAAQIEPSEFPYYRPPDIFNPALHPPAEAVDVLSIVEAGGEFSSVLVPHNAENLINFKKPKFKSIPSVPVGKGVELSTKAGDEFCDGSLESWCGKRKSSDCLLYGHNDGRNGLFFDGYSGWIVLNLPDVKNGIIAVRMETWHSPKSVSKTNGWTSVNNNKRKRVLEAGAVAPTSRHGHNITILPYSSRRLKAKPADYCPEFRFEYSVDGNVTSLDAGQFSDRKIQVQRVFEMLVLMDDRSYTGGKDQEAELAIRMVGCGRKKVFRLSHVFWS